MSILFKNIKELVQVRSGPVSYVAGAAMKDLPTIKNAYLVVENGRIKDFGSMNKCPNLVGVEVVDVTGKIVMPTWCDAHTHIVYAGNREREFVDRINGFSYEEIADRGGGILNSAKKLEHTLEEELYLESKKRLDEIIEQGTGAVEIKSGYGLTVEAELKMLRLIKRLKEHTNIEIRATFLGAHAVPNAYKENKTGYIKMLINDLMPIVAQEKLAEFIDVFCETGYFSAADTEMILEAGKKHGLIPKIHVNQFTSIGGIQVGVKYAALSVDHLEVMTDQDIESLKDSETMPVALPGCSYFLSIPYTPARKMLKAGLPLALASDYNPGSAPSGNMNFVVATACIKMAMTPEEAINAATLNSAYAMGVEKEVGSVSMGKLANLIITKPVHSYASIPYLFGSNKIEKVYLRGTKVYEFMS